MRSKVALEKMSTTSSWSDGIARSISKINVMDLVPRSLEMVRRSPQWTSTGEGKKCELCQVPDEVYASLTRDQAVFQVLERGGGNFQINFEAKTRHETTTLNTQGLLIEGLRLVDEARRDPGGGSEEEEDVLLDS